MKSIDEKEVLWEKRIEDYRNSGQGLSKWCSEHNISIYAMNYYLYAKPKQNKKAVVNEDNFIPVVVDTKTNQTIMILIIQPQLAWMKKTDLNLLKKIMEVINYD